MVRVPKAAGSTEDLAAGSGALLQTPGAMTLLRAYAAIGNQRQRTALVNLAWALAEQERSERGDRSGPL